MLPAIIVLACIGIGISIYAYFVEQKLDRNPLYKPFCDISDRISCSKPLKSKYSRMLIMSTPIACLIFYALVIVLALLHMPLLLKLLTIVGAIVSLAFAYILYFRIKTVCLLCTALYIINGALLFCALGLK